MLEKKNIPALLLFIDFEKAFDSLEWSFILNALKFFGFGESLTKWVKTFYCKTESCILNYGWASNFFETQRGVRQGCPLSPYLFILAAEVLASAIRKNGNIKGITVNNIEIKISQYADDTTLILDGSKNSLLSSLAVLDDFSKVSELRLNDKKTEALWIGSSIENDKILLPGKNLKWPKTKVKTLGLWISTDPDLSTRLNYDEKLEKVEEILNCWKYRRLTLLGKITVLKSSPTVLLVSKMGDLAGKKELLKQLMHTKNDKTCQKKPQVAKAQNKILCIRLPSSPALLVISLSPVPYLSPLEHERGLYRRESVRPVRFKSGFNLLR